MTARRLWRRIEPGYYHLAGTPVFVANMKGQSVKWSGLQPTSWVVRAEPNPRQHRAGLRSRTLGEYESKAKAQEKAIQWAREEGWL